MLSMKWNLAVRLVTIVFLSVALGLAQGPAGQPGSSAGQAASKDKKPAPFASAPAPAEPKPAPKTVKPTDTVLWIGNEGITAERFEALLRAVPPQFEQASQAMGKKQFASQYGMLLGLTRTAEKEKIDKAPFFQDQVEFARMQLLAQLVFADISKRTQVVQDADVEKYYKEHIGDFQQIKVRGIFIGLAPPSKPLDPEKKDVAAGGAPTNEKKETPKPRTDAEAKGLIMKLREKIMAGASFADVAKESSEEPATAPKGGDFGTVRRGQLPVNIEKAVFALKPKEVSQPVQEARGFYLFTVDEVRITTMDEAQLQIRGQLGQQQLMGALEKVKQDFPIKFNEDYFGPSEPAPIAAPAQPAPPAKNPQD